MITKFDLPKVDLNKKMLGRVTSDATLLQNGLPIHIPLIMGNIENTTNKEVFLNTKGNRIFKNDISCLPKLSPNLKARNYILVKKEDNTSLTRVLVRKNGVYCVPKNTKVEVTFTHGKISSATFNTDTFIS